MNSLNLELKKYSKDMGVDFLEAADLGTAREFVYRHGGEHITGYPRGVSIGIRLVDSVPSNHQSPKMSTSELICAETTLKEDLNYLARASVDYVFTHAHMEKPTFNKHPEHLHCLERME